MTIAIYKPNAITNVEFVFTQFNDLEPTFGLDDVSHTASGAVYPGFTGSSVSEAYLDFSTPQVATFLDAVNVEGVACNYEDEVTDIEFQKYENLKSRLSSASTSHTRLRANLSYMYWKSISADARGDAQIMGRLKAISDGTNPPLVASKAALVGMPTVTELFGLGPVQIAYTGQSLISVCQGGWTWENNIVERSQTCSGDPYETFSAIETVSPVLTVRGVEDVDAVLALLPLGKNLVTVNCFLRKRTQGGGFVASATAQHIRLSATVGSIKPIGARSFQISLHGFTFNTAVALP